MSQLVLTLFFHAVIDYVMVSKHAKILVQDSIGSIVSLIEKYSLNYQRPS